MTQNTEQNVRTREEQISMMAEFIRTGPSGKGLEGWLSAHIRSAEARGRAEAVLKMAFSTEQKAIEERKAGKRGEAFWRVCLINALTDLEGWNNKEARSHIDLLISKFKEVGAEEQRRKDAEGGHG
ncbi:hypothetical protein [Gluconobacter cerinus]|uniref:hypothetical protein n=1 Tax=Gluconobacter cerinus TaxID=38307 RepID=UPI001B8A9561|nr:hypothetical protein [Gluconobacter cerinus]MBS1035027.1 hypothetical protein [Gluconobacter cerinus]